MPWWEILDHPSLETLGGILVLSLVLTAVLLAVALGLAFVWHKWKTGRKRQRLAKDRAAATAAEPPKAR